MKTGFKPRKNIFLSMFIPCSLLFITSNIKYCATKWFPHYYLFSVCINLHEVKKKVQNQFNTFVCINLRPLTKDACKPQMTTKREENLMHYKNKTFHFFSINSRSKENWKRGCSQEHHKQKVECRKESYLELEKKIRLKKTDNTHSHTRKKSQFHIQNGLITHFEHPFWCANSKQNEMLFLQTVLFVTNSIQLIFARAIDSLLLINFSQKYLFQCIHCLSFACKSLIFLLYWKKEEKNTYKLHFKQTVHHLIMHFQFFFS